MLVAPGTTSAQEFQLSGRAMSVLGADTVPLVDEWVTLHQISAAGGLMVDSSRTDPEGVYVLSAPMRDTSALYISSVRFKDITYFSNPVRSVQFTADTAATLFVYDTSSVAPPLVLVQRHLVVRRVSEDGRRAVLELVVLENRGNLARIAGNGAVWHGMVPEGAFGLQVGESDISPEALQRSGDSLSLVAPVPPGQKQLVFSYSIPADDELVVPVPQLTERLQVLLEDTSAVVTGSLLPGGMEQLDDMRFVRFDASMVPAGAPVVVHFSDQPFVVGDYWWLVIVAVLLAFAAAGVLWWRRVEPVAVSSDDPDVLAARIAMLDENFERERANMTDGERTNYENVRADLKARLNVALARKNYGR